MGSLHAAEDSVLRTALQVYKRAHKPVISESTGGRWLAGGGHLLPDAMERRWRLSSGLPGKRFGSNR